MSFLDENLREIAAAAIAFTDIWQDPWIADNIATQLTCAEFDHLMSLLEVCGHEDAVVMWRESHAHGDEETDDCMHAEYLALKASGELVRK